MTAAGTTNPRVFVAGHRGMVGSALVRKLSAAGNVELLLRRREQLDLTRQSDVEQFFATEEIDQVYLAAAKVGGILANDNYPADFIRDNLQIQVNVLEAARQAGVSRLLLLGSSCIYPRNAPQPMPEECLLTGVLEPTNEPYAIAKIAGIKMCESYRRQYGCDFRSIMPTNLYGPNDNFDLETSHVLPALLRKFHEAKVSNDSEVLVWGSGNPRREFLHVDDMADACLVLMGMNEQEFWAQVPVRNSQVNVGTGEDISIADLATMIVAIVGYRGETRFDPSKPDGSPRKLLDVSRIHSMGWKAKIGLHEGLKQTYQWMLDSKGEASVNREDRDPTMTKSLQDQLLELGLASRRPAQKKSGPAKPGSGKKTKNKRNDRAANKAGKHAKPHRPEKSTGKQGTAPDPENLTLEQAYRLRKQEEATLKQQEQQKKREQERKRREINRSIKAIVEPNRKNQVDAEIPRYFMYKGRIRKVNVTPEQRDDLNQGKMGVVYLSGAYHLLAPDHVEQVRQLSQEHVPDLTVDTGDQTDDGVPDDLMW